MFVDANAQTSAQQTASTQARQQFEQELQSLRDKEDTAASAAGDSASDPVVTAIGVPVEEVAEASADDYTDYDLDMVKVDDMVQQTSTSAAASSSAATQPAQASAGSRTVSSSDATESTQTAASGSAATSSSPSFFDVEVKHTFQYCNADTHYVLLRRKANSSAAKWHVRVHPIGTSYWIEQTSGDSISNRWHVVNIQSPHGPAAAAYLLKVLLPYIVLWTSVHPVRAARPWLMVSSYVEMAINILKVFLGRRAMALCEFLLRIGGNPRFRAERQQYSLEYLGFLNISRMKWQESALAPKTSAAATEAALQIRQLEERQQMIAKQQQEQQTSQQQQDSPPTEFSIAKTFSQYSLPEDSSTWNRSGGIDLKQFAHSLMWKHAFQLCSDVKLRMDHLVGSNGEQGCRNATAAGSLCYLWQCVTGAQVDFSRWNQKQFWPDFRAVSKSTTGSALDGAPFPALGKDVANTLDMFAVYVLAHHGGGSKLLAGLSNYQQLGKACSQMLSEIRKKDVVTDQQQLTADILRLQSDNAAAIGLSQSLTVQQLTIQQQQQTHTSAVAMMTSTAASTSNATGTKHMRSPPQRSLTPDQVCKHQYQWT